MSDQKLPLFLCSLSLLLKEKIHSSIEIDIVKKTMYVHLTSRIDLQPYYYRIDSIVVRIYIAHPVSLHFVQQKGLEYDYILFR